MNTERRFLGNAELRSEGGGKVISGYAARFNSLSKVLFEQGGFFRERIMPGAFARALREKQDTKCLVDHNASQILGRVKSGTLELFEDRYGLRFRCTVPDTSAGRDVTESLRRGDLSDCSFAFRNPQDRWVNDGNAEVRELLDMDLQDVSVVTFPAYNETSAAVDSRSYFPDGVPTVLRERIARIAAPAPISDEEFRQRKLASLRASALMFD